MKNNQRIKKLCRTLAALALTICVLAADMSPALALVTQADIDALKSDATDLTAQRKELQRKLDELANDKSSAIQRKNLLDQQIANTTSQIANVEAQIDKYAALISQKEAELADAEEREAAQYELFCQRVRAMEKRGTVSYWSVLFKADSFTCLLYTSDAADD